MQKCQIIRQSVTSRCKDKANNEKKNIKNKSTFKSKNTPRTLT